MSQVELYFLAREDHRELVPDGDCLRIKVNAEIGAVLAFGTREAAHEFARRCQVSAQVLELHQLASGLIGSVPLLVFRTADEVDLAYRDAGSYDFTTHLEDWPRQ
jgi:hypothetical protein